MLTILPQSPSNDNSTRAEARMKRLVDALEDVVRAEIGSDESFAGLEDRALEVSNEAVRRVLSDALHRIEEELGDGDVLIKGERYTPHGRGEGKYPSLVGWLVVPRTNYRKVGVRNGPTAIALDLAAGLVEGMTPALAERVAMGNGEAESRALHQQMLSSRRVPPSRAVLAKLGTAVGTALHHDAATIEAMARRSEKLPAGAARICIGLDRTAIPMEEDLPEGTAPKPRKKERLRVAPSPVEVNFRMGFAGTVTIVDADGDMLRGFKYAASAEDGPAQILHSIMQDVRRALRQDSSLSVLLVQDAAPEMWNVMTASLTAEPTVTTWDEVIDHPHAMAHLWAAAEAIDEDTQELMGKWLAALRDNDDAIETIHQRIATELDQGYVPERRAVLMAEDTYLKNNKHRLRYASLRDAGSPIGSGPTEGACKSFVACRCKRSGQRWRNPGLRAALACRTQHLNDRLSIAMSTLRRRRYSADIQVAA